MIVRSGRSLTPVTSLFGDYTHHHARRPPPPPRLARSARRGAGRRLGLRLRLPAGRVARLLRWQGAYLPPPRHSRLNPLGSRRSLPFDNLASLLRPIVFLSSLEIFVFWQAHPLPSSLLAIASFWRSPAVPRCAKRPTRSSRCRSRARRTSSSRPCPAPAGASPSTPMPPASRPSPPLPVRPASAHSRCASLRICVSPFSLSIRSITSPS